jgi:hypothetical protein
MMAVLLPLVLLLLAPATVTVVGFDASKLRIKARGVQR